MNPNLVKIADPKKPGDFLLISRGAYDPSVHRLFGEVEPAKAQAKEAGEVAPAASPAPKARQTRKRKA